MNYTLVEDSDSIWLKAVRPLIKAARSVYIQGTNIVSILPSERAIQLYYKFRKKSYDLQWSMDPGYRKGLARLVEMTVDENDRVLDVGCGTGSATVVAADKAREVLGIDLSSHMIELAREKVVKKRLENTSFVACSVEEFHPEEQYDKVISSFMIPHVKPAMRASIYACMYRFLKPGGTVGLFGSRGEVCPVYETRAKAEANLRQAGFEDIELIDIYDIYRIAIARKPE